MTPPNLLHELAEHIRALGSRPPTAESRREVEGYLFSKWHGLQIVAGRVLGDWGGPESIAALRAWLMRSYAKTHRHNVRQGASDCLARCVTAADADWLLDLHFRSPGALGRFDLVRAAAALPLDALTPRLEKVLQFGGPEQRIRAFLVMGYRPDRLVALARVTSRRHLFDDETCRQIDQYFGWWEAHERNDAGSSQRRRYLRK
jgi:hypothetical protein